MIKKNKTQLTISLILNIAVVIMEIIGGILCANRIGADMFVFYTTDSNIFSLITSALFAAFAGRALMQNNLSVIPKWVRILKLMSTCCLAVTFIVVITVLSPTSEGGYVHMLLEDDLLYYHLLCPLVSIISYIFFEIHADLTVKNSIASTIPTFVYAVVAIILNLLYIIYGPYPFLHIYEQPVYMSVIWFLVIVGGAFGVSCVIRTFGKIFSKQKKISE